MTTTSVTTGAHTVLDREIQLPVVVRDATAAVAFYLVSAQAAQEMIAESGLRVARVLPGRTVCTIGTMNYKDGDLDRYHEVALTFFVHEPGSRPLPFVSALSGMARGTLSAYVHWLPVDAELSCEAGRRIWGFPKFMSRIEIEREERSERSTLFVDGERVLTQAVQMEGTRSFNDRRQTSYTFRDGVLRKAPSTMSAEEMGVRPGGGTLDLGRHPMAGELRRLGLPKKPLFTTYMGKMSGRFYEAEPVPISCGP